MIIMEQASINHLYELPFEFKFLEPSTRSQQGFSLRVCRVDAREGSEAASYVCWVRGGRVVMLMVAMHYITRRVVAPSYMIIRVSEF